MDKRYDDLSAAMREVAEHRDKRLRSAGAAISAHRLGRLNAAVASQFPVETALRAAADARDKSLEQMPVLPAHAALLLHSHLIARPPGVLQSGASQWLNAAVQTFWAAFRSPTRFAAALALIVVGVGALHFGSFARKRGSVPASLNPPHLYFAAQPAGESEYQDRLEKGFLREPGDELTLRVSTIELASLQPSLLTINRALLADRHDFERGLPLDLPIRQILIDGDTTATP